jgi:hypothetical protein
VILERHHGRGYHEPGKGGVSFCFSRLKVGEKDVLKRLDVFVVGENPMEASLPKPASRQSLSGLNAIRQHYHWHAFSNGTGLSL